MKEAMEAAKGVLAGQDKPAPKGKAKMREMMLRKGHKGGFIAKHQMENENGGGETHEFPLSDIKQLHDHIDEHMGDVKEAPSGEEE